MQELSLNYDKIYKIYQDKYSAEVNYQMLNEIYYFVERNGFVPRFSAKKNENKEENK